MIKFLLISFGIVVLLWGFLAILVVISSKK